MVARADSNAWPYVVSQYVGVGGGGWVCKCGLGEGGRGGLGWGGDKVSKSGRGLAGPGGCWVSWGRRDVGVGRGVEQVIVYSGPV